MGKHHRKWYLDEEIASNKRVQEMMDDLETNQSVEVIGNIHENPELLEKGE